MLRETLSEAMKDAMRAKDQVTLRTVRLIMAAIKDRDIAARGNGKPEGLDDGEIQSLLVTMIKQRRDSITQYEAGGRPELAAGEAEEITVIERFLPRQLDDAEMAAAIDEAIKASEATCIKDMGRCMAELKARFAGQMDFTKASAIVRQKLG